VPTLYARAIRRAAEITGEADLALQLGVTSAQLRFWIQGAAVPPGDAFLKVVDILGDHALHELKRPLPPDRGTSG
jgi:DNA-binding transcriptional regulator YiaG